MPASNLAVVFQPGLIRGPDNFGPPSTTVPGAIPIPNVPSMPGSGETSEANSAFSPPQFPQMSRSSSNPANQLPEVAGSAASSIVGQSNVLELQRRQDEIKINQEVLEFLINHQDHFVALPEPQSSSSAEASPVSPQSASAGWSQSKPIAQPTPQRAQPVAAHEQALQSVHQQPYPLSPPQAPFASMQISQSGSRQGSPSRSSMLNVSDAPVIASRSQSVQHEKRGPAPISVARAAPGPATATFPLQQHFNQQQAHQQPQTQQSSYKEKDAARQPRKLKKGRTPNSSGPGTPLSPAASTSFWDPSNNQLRPVLDGKQAQSRSSSPVSHAPSTGRGSHVGSSLPSPIHTGIASPYDDDDVPLSAVTLRAGSGSVSPSAGGVKRSRTLPSPGASRGPSPRSVCVFLVDCSN